MGKPVMITSFVDANLMADHSTGRSQTGILHLFNKTPIDWFSKAQTSVETATYGSEFVAARICVDQVIDLRNTLRYLGVPLAIVNGNDASFMFGDNMSVVNSSVLPSGKLQKRAHLLNYHRVREAQAVGTVKFVHMDGKENPADIMTKARSSREWFPLMKPLLFWRKLTDTPIGIITEGSESRSAESAMPPLEEPGVLQQSSRLPLAQVIGYQ